MIWFYLVIVLEFVGGGDLLDFIQHHGPIREDVVKSWAAQMIDGMAVSFLNLADLCSSFHYTY